MLPNIQFLKRRLEQVIINKTQQGHDTDGLMDKLEQLPNSYDAYHNLARHVAQLPLRAGWPYVEPNELSEILAECATNRPTDKLASVDTETIAPHIETAFLSAVCGCILGKPIEVNPTLAELRQAGESCNEWPIRDYISEEFLEALGRRNETAPETSRHHIHYVAPDDDLNYSVLGMLALEQHGPTFTQFDLLRLWQENLPSVWTWGPERTMVTQAALAALDSESFEADVYDLKGWVSTWNPNDEACGAAIRVDAYSYATPGYPALAVELAWRDASMTHRRTGVYASMFIAAAIATAFVVDEPLDIFETALMFIPQRSRFYKAMSDCFELVVKATDWLDGYNQIHQKYGEYGHCLLYQECGLLMNTARFATNVGDAICKQVAQGCDTDSFGEIIGSIMGAYFGVGSLEERWLKPFQDDFRTSLASFHDRSLTSVARRMGQLPQRISMN